MIFFKILNIFFIVLICRIDSQAQTIQEYEVPIQFSINQTGINRYITSQWASIQTNWAGTYEGLTYSLQLNRPSILLSNGNITIVLELVFSSESYNGTLTITPTLNIQTIALSGDNIFASYVNLRDRIDFIIGITDPRVRNIIESHLAPINWIMYEGKIFTQPDLRLSNIADIRWVGIPDVSFAVDNEEIIITLTPNLFVTKPYYKIYVRILDHGYYGLKILSNNYFELERQTLTTTYGDHVFTPIDTTIPSQYNETIGEYSIELVNPGISVSTTNATYNFIIGRGNSKILVERNYSLGSIVPFWDILYTNFSSY